jgi:uncharacterized damage-inducible protein DinB
MTPQKNSANATLIAAWQEAARLTRDFFAHCLYEQLTSPLPRPGLNTLAKHAREMALVRREYASLLGGAPTDFGSVVAITIGDEDYKPTSVADVLRELDESQSSVDQAISAVDDWLVKVPFMATELPQEAILELVSRHESLHQGQMVAYGYLLGTGFPPSWFEAWALPTEGM